MQGLLCMQAIADQHNQVMHIPYAIHKTHKLELASISLKPISRCQIHQVTCLRIYGITDKWLGMHAVLCSHVIANQLEWPTEASGAHKIRYKIDTQLKLDVIKRKLKSKSNSQIHRVTRLRNSGITSINRVTDILCVQVHTYQLQPMTD